MSPRQNDADIPSPARPGKGAVLALFDFDGTLTTHETMPVFVRRSVSAARLAYGQFMLAPLIIGYRLGLVSGRRVRQAIVRVGYRGVSATALESLGEAFARDYLSGAIRPEAMRCLDWHRGQGHRVVVVSGGLDVYLAPWCRAHGLELVCSALEREGDVLTGSYLGEQCVLEEKVRRVRAALDLGGHGTIYAYGDTVEDEPLLSLATHAYYGGLPWPMNRQVPGGAAPYSVPT